MVAVFDTVFHRNMPSRASTYPLPFELAQSHHIRRYGFHGISHEYLVRRYAQIQSASVENTKVITLHLESGCSSCAISGGRSIDTSMGFTPLEGLMMGTRSGSVDPGLLLYLQTHYNVSAVDLEDTLTNRSGLLGVSGVAPDMRLVLKAADEGNEDAKLAYDRYILSARRAAGAAAGVLGGVDTIVFTGGVGEHQPRVRRDIGAAFEGLQLDEGVNANGEEGLISSPDSRIRALVVRAREDLVLLNEVRRYS